MKYSVIIPCYNAAKTIERALDSLVNQTFSDWEVICVDDCSVDNTIKVIQSYIEKHRDANICIICNEKNSGPGVSRNNGIAVAQGEYLCFLDSDDYYADDYFTLIDKVIGMFDAEIVFYGFNQVIGAKVRRRPLTLRERREEYMALIGGSFWGGAWSRKLWEGITIPSISNAEDIAVIPVLISRAKNVAAIPDCLYYYIHSNNSLSGKNIPQVSYNFVTSFQYTLQNIDIERYKEEVEFHGIKTVIYGATLNALKAGMSNSDIIGLWTEFEDKYPNWRGNKYLNSYPLIKRSFVWMASKRSFWCMRLFTKFHVLLLKTIG